MEKNTNNGWVAIVIISGLILGICIFAHCKFDSIVEISTIIGIIGSLASVTGIVVTIKQVSTSITASRAAETAAKKAASQLSDFMQATDLSAISSEITHVETLLSAKEFLAAQIFISKIKSMLVKIRDGNIELSDNIRTKTENTISDLGIDIANLSKVNRNNNSVLLSVNEIVNHIECAKEVFSSCEELIMKSKRQ